MQAWAGHIGQVWQETTCVRASGPSDPGEGAWGWREAFLESKCVVCVCMCLCACRGGVGVHACVRVQ